MQSLETNIPHFLRCVVCFKIPQKAISLDKIRIICRKCQKTNNRQQHSLDDIFKYLLQNFKITCSKCKQMIVCQEYENHKIICNQQNKLNYQLQNKDDCNFQRKKRYIRGLVQAYIMESESDCLLKNQIQVQCQYCLRFMPVLQFYEHQHNCQEFKIDCGNYNCIWQGKRKDFLSHFGKCLNNTLNLIDTELEQQIITRHLLEQQQEIINIEEYEFFENQQQLNNNYNFTYQQSTDTYIFD